ncbi:ribosome silencing factor [Parvicella tangerina]|uniref:Ribosomal silencing factor RsfS n=1 Tax=Parvicella tangerina TaxID=2829795 RepID=A0A916JQJ8_9FLAO|nr:ribosome silencing factor [Parvicella tangerina]CAG5086399.1 Ribosomal silencing factor RsfS [Parvicella tangerina]
MTQEKNAASVLLKETIIEGVTDLKAKDPVCIDLRETDGAVTDFFVICHGDSSTHIDGIANSVTKNVSKKLGQRPWHHEGKQSAEWKLLDYVDVVVHIFNKESRDFYDLEGLWADAPIERIEEVK